MPRALGGVLQQAHIPLPLVCFLNEKEKKYALHFHVEPIKSFKKKKKKIKKKKRVKPNCCMLICNYVKSEQVIDCKILQFFL